MNGTNNFCICKKMLVIYIKHMVIKRNSLLNLDSNSPKILPPIKILEIYTSKMIWISKRLVTYVTKYIETLSTEHFKIALKNFFFTNMILWGRVCIICIN